MANVMTLANAMRCVAETLALQSPEPLREGIRAIGEAAAKVAEDEQAQVRAYWQSDAPGRGLSFGQWVRDRG